MLLDLNEMTTDVLKQLLVNNCHMECPIITQSIQFWSLFYTKRNGDSELAKYCWNYNCFALNCSWRPSTMVLSKFQIRYTINIFLRFDFIEWVIIGIYLKISNRKWNKFQKLKLGQYQKCQNILDKNQIFSFQS